MNRAFLALVFLASAACSTPQTPPRFVELHGSATEPYATLGRQQWLNTTIVASRRDLYRISREVFGHPLEYDPPEVPGWGGPLVFRDTATGHIVTDFGVGAMGYFEVTFTQSNPPKVAWTYFTDYDRSVQLPDVVALHRLTSQRYAQRNSQ